MQLFKKKQQEGRRVSGVATGRNRVTYSYRQSRAPATHESGSRQKPFSATTPKLSLFTKHKGILRNLPAIIGCVAIIASFFYATMLGTTPVIRIVDEETPGAVLLKDSNAYRQAAEKVLKASPLHRSKFSFDSAKVAQEFDALFPELASTSVITPVLGNKPVFVIRPIRPSFVLSSAGQTHIINHYGVAVAPLNTVEQASKLRLVSVVDKSDIVLESGKQALSVSQTEFINTVIAQLSDKKLTIKSIVLPLSPYDVELRIQGSDYMVRMNSGVDPKVQVGNFLALKQRADKGSVTVREYMDVRVEGRAYYK